MARATDDLLWFARDKVEKAARAEAKNVNKDTDFSKMKMKALKLLLKERGIKCEGCRFKRDLSERFRSLDPFSAPRQQRFQTLIRPELTGDSRSISTH